MCDGTHAAFELMAANRDNQHHHSRLKMTTTAMDGQEEINAATEFDSSDHQLERDSTTRRRSTKPRNYQMTTGPVKGGRHALKSLVHRLFSWSARKTFSLSLVVSVAKIICLASLVTLNTKCDDEMQLASSRADTHGQNQQNQRQHQPQSQIELFDLIKQQQPQQQHQQGQRDSRGIFNLDELLSTQDSSSSLSYNLINPSNELTMTSDNQQAGDTNFNQDAQQQQQLRQAMHEQRANDTPESDQLETAQTRAQGNAVASATNTSESSGKAADAGVQASGGAASPAPSAGSGASAASSLSDHLSAVNNLLHQAGQIGLSAAQQNVALSEAIINSVTNSLVGTNRKQQSAQATGAPQQAQPNVARPINVVGQSIDGNIDYNPNTNTIDGFINFPTNFSGIKPSLSGAMRPLLLAAIKTVPVKFGSVGWKLLKLLAWKKIYKAHHPKSGEIIIEQETKHGGSGSVDMDKGSKLGSKISDHFDSKFKTAKMGSPFMGSGGGGSGGDDWAPMMRSPGLGGGDMFSGGWPHGDSHAASASMIYQRHLLPPGMSNPLMGGGAGQQQAAAAAAAAAATAAAIQSHWQQQQQQQMMADETSENSQHSRSNQTSGASQSASAQGALRRKKATFGGGNWFAANPAHTYAAAAAAANAAAALATQQQQQQRLANIMRAYELGGHSTDHSGASGSGNGMHHALATGLMYQSLFDNAAAMAVQNTVRLPGMDQHHGQHQSPLANAEFLDQSDTLSGSSFDSFASSGTESLNDHNPLNLMQRQDLERGSQFGITPIEHMMGQRGLSTDGNLGGAPMQLAGPHRSGSLLDGMADFDDTPAGKLLGHALNESSSHQIHRFMNANHHQNIGWK